MAMPILLLVLDDYMYMYQSVHVSIVLLAMFSHVKGSYHDEVFNFFPILADFASWSDI